MNALIRTTLAIVLVIAAAGPRAGWAQPQPRQTSVPLDPEVMARCEVEIRRLEARNQKEMATELRKQLDAFANDPQVHQAVLEETSQRIAEAREAFNRYYAQLVAEGQQEGAERMRQLFEISLTGAPVNAGAPVERAGPTPTPQ